ncbi:MAG: hypothetical protein ABSD59_21760 [Terracidiphilus sp.]|jgi:hypothetical protein
MNDEGCFLDTTLLAEALLKAQAKRLKARLKIREYKRSVLPVYAIKEFKAGALKNYIWLHNRIVDTQSLSRTIDAIHNAFHRPYLRGTAEEALEFATEMLVGSDLSKADTREKTQQALADSLRYHLRRQIDTAWRERRKLTTEVVDELSCYAEAAHSYNEGTHYIDSDRQECDLSDECCLVQKLRGRRGDLRKLIKAISGSSRFEDENRRKALNRLLKRPIKSFGEKSCKALGDAYFALQCPKDCVILTSNAKDHQVLAGALKKKVVRYSSKET